jgi:hypothetical protein
MMCEPSPACGRGSPASITWTLCMPFDAGGVRGSLVANPLSSSVFYFFGILLRSIEGRLNQVLREIHPKIKKPNRKSQYD